MNILEFPDEILLTFCKYVDFKSRINLRLSCRQLNFLLPNPKDNVTEDQVNEWRRKMKVMLGLGLIENAMCQTFKIISQLDWRKKMFIGCEGDRLYLCYSYFAGSVFYSCIKDNPEISLVCSGTSTGVLYEDALYAKFEREKQVSIFEYPNENAMMLYNLFMEFVCIDQNKKKKVIDKYHIAKFANCCMENLDICDTIVKNYTNSVYIVPMMKKPIEVFKSPIEQLRSQVRSEMSRYFMDGEEAEQFLCAM